MAAPGVGDQGGKILVSLAAAPTSGPTARDTRIFPVKQAAAAVGQCRMMHIYDKLFAEYNRTGDSTSSPVRRIWATVRYFKFSPNRSSTYLDRATRCITNLESAISVSFYSVFLSMEFKF